MLQIYQTPSNKNSSFGHFAILFISTNNFPVIKSHGNSSRVFSFSVEEDSLTHNLSRIYPLRICKISMENCQKSIVLTTLLVLALINRRFERLLELHGACSLKNGIRLYDRHDRIR